MPHQNLSMIPPLHAAYLCLFYSLDVYSTELGNEKLYQLSMSRRYENFRIVSFCFITFYSFLNNYQKSETIVCTVIGILGDVVME